MNNEITLTLSASPSGENSFEILAITAGEAKGHNLAFGADVLQSSLPLWDGLPVFLDHPKLNGLGHPSVRDLAGSLSSPTWDASSEGIRLNLIPSGPAAGVLSDLRAAARENPAIMKAVGFSAVVNLEHDGKGKVTKIIRVHSVDAVIDPARGGKFLSERASSEHHSSQRHESQGTSALSPDTMKGENSMVVNNPPEPAALSEQELAALNLQGADEKIKNLQVKSEQADAVMLSMCANLLKASLAASKLPAASQAVIEKSFKDRIFQPTELETAIQDKRTELSEVIASQVVSGPARNIAQMATTDNQLRAAVDDMFGIPRDAALKDVKPARLSGIRELYTLLTGDVEMTGGYFGERIMLATTADFTGLIKNALNKLVAQGWEQMGTAGYDWWKNIVNIEHFNSLQTITGTLVGTVGSLPSVSEQGEYQEIVIGDSPETASFTKYGGYVPLTIELLDKDDTRKLRSYGVELGKAGIRNISEQIAAIFTQASGAGPTMADTGALFNATAVTTAGGHANLLTTALGTDFTAWDAVAAAVYNQPLLIKNATGYYGTGKKMAIEPRFCLVPRALKAAAEALFIPRWASTVEAAIASKGGPTYGGFVQPLTVPEWTDATDWAAACDPRIAPSIYVGERFGLMPEIFVAGRETDPAVFMNDEHRIKIRHFLAVLVADFRPLHKSNVA